ncbi:phenylalanine ammonia-lyase [Aspergillus sclerotioniger CBS 115572]|uniref:Phenylalanine ammonia-lyase n=1 Tax=Aspergillus sclerotioniger CBS 115572 TaxID=1450535 RepID=A0A317X931_9EURO|nr:phenylalanine ammonia-lyase [Aspergillus sclerotioniger CBS 115572]PWY94681.1 phenylalanine ammonia-lyase [Aspergillus sclerotioniger CBS 115572]
MNNVLIRHWYALNNALTTSNISCNLDGKTLDLATVVAGARYGKRISLSQSTREKVHRSEEALKKHLAGGELVYGVNTGFGGSADTTTHAVNKLQENLLQMLQAGIKVDGSSPVVANKEYKNVLPLDDPISATIMPESWTRATMIIRLNCLALGASGIRQSVLDVLLQMIEHQITPRVPLRGSISASGDLNPLSYIGGAMQGHPSIYVWKRDRVSNCQVKGADLALAESSIPPVRLNAKEGLAIVNGTATSAAVGGLALHETLGLAAVSQVLAAMSVEALHGMSESFDPFFARVRPHPGQTTAANNLCRFLSQSKLLNDGDALGPGNLRQDRYSIRTSAQWMGPILEDLELAYQQISAELNSVTDNPLIDTVGDSARILHGGNFQAKSVTSAVEKARQAVQSMGRMLFAQCTELIDPSKNNGLPPNLSADEPSISFTFKGVDILIAALQSELGFLANPVGSHVQTAEMGNQALNSLALISSRYTLEAVTVLSQMAAAHLVSVCQALDLRVINIQFMQALEQDFVKIFNESFKVYAAWSKVSPTVSKDAWFAFIKQVGQLQSVDSCDRFHRAARAILPTFLTKLPPTDVSPSIIQSWIDCIGSQAVEIYRQTLKIYCKSPDATPYLGEASRKMYTCVRQNLKLPFITEGTLWRPEDPNRKQSGEAAAPPLPTMGDVVGIAYDAIRRGSLYTVAVECIRNAEQDTVKCRHCLEKNVFRARMSRI